MSDDELRSELGLDGVAPELRGMVTTQHRRRVDDRAKFREEHCHGTTQGSKPTPSCKLPRRKSIRR
jgi:hypothetical protein